MYDSLGPNGRFRWLIFPVRLMLTKSTHSSPSSCPTNHINILYTYITYFIKINFKVGMRHYYLTSPNVTES